MHKIFAVIFKPDRILPPRVDASAYLGRAKSVKGDCLEAMPSEQSFF